MKDQFKKVKWNDKLVKDFARVYVGNKSYWEYMNHSSIEDKLKLFKQLNNIED
tara:strand:- start:527 stop:685 length:159 start_codon:yes stop_codon:yes gene_type:complete